MDNRLKSIKYAVTLLPNINNSTREIDRNADYAAVFTDLEGGTKEYFITVSAIICDAKMKGATLRYGNNHTL